MLGSSDWGPGTWGKGVQEPEVVIESLRSLKVGKVGTVPVGSKIRSLGRREMKGGSWGGVGSWGGN